MSNNRLEREHRFSVMHREAGAFVANEFDATRMEAVPPTIPVSTATRLIARFALNILDLKTQSVTARLEAVEKERDVIVDGLAAELFKIRGLGYQSQILALTAYIEKLKEKP